MLDPISYQATSPHLQNKFQFRAEVGGWAVARVCINASNFAAAAYLPIPPPNPPKPSPNFEKVQRNIVCDKQISALILMDKMSDDSVGM